MMSEAGRRPALLAALLLGLAGLAAAPSFARDHHIAAPGSAQTQTPDGSSAAPWPGLGAALTSGQVKGGDQLLLAPAHYGALQFRGVHFSPAVTIRSATQDRAHVTLIGLRNSSGLVFKSLDVWPLEPVTERRRPLVRTDAASSKLVFEDLDIRGGPEALNYLDWQAEDWLSRWEVNGVRLNGPDMALLDSRLTAVANGIEAWGKRGRVIGNEVRGFSRDAMRGVGAHSLFRGNTVRNCIKVSNNHDDGFQSWSASGGGGAPERVQGLVLDGNRIFEWTGPANHPLRCSLQGIGMFNGPYEDWVIQNNLILVSAYHGITLTDAHRARVVNNTVLHIDGIAGKNPWIMQRGGSQTGPDANLFANNVATAFKLGKHVSPAQQGNLQIRYPYRLFEDPARLDYRPKAGSPLINAARPAHAPDHDIQGTPRPQRGQPDLGAFELP